MSHFWENNREETCQERSKAEGEKNNILCITAYLKDCGFGSSSEMNQCIVCPSQIVPHTNPPHIILLFMELKLANELN